MEWVALGPMSSILLGLRAAVCTGMELRILVPAAKAGVPSPPCLGVVAQPVRGHSGVEVLSETRAVHALILDINRP